jgi:hypothetical protein
VQNEVWARCRDFRKTLDQACSRILAKRQADLAPAKETDGAGNRALVASIVAIRLSARLPPEMRPDAKRSGKAQRGLEKRDGPAIGAGIDMANASTKPRLREGKRGGKTSGAGAGSEYVGLRIGSESDIVPPLLAYLYRRRKFGELAPRFFTGRFFARRRS